MKQPVANSRTHCDRILAVGLLSAFACALSTACSIATPSPTELADAAPSNGAPDLAVFSDLRRPNADLNSFGHPQRLLDHAYQLLSQTTDDYVAALGPDGLLAVPFEGNSPVTIIRSCNLVWGSGKTIFCLWPMVIPGLGPLTLWNAQSGVRQFAQRSLFLAATASDDGKFVFYTEDTTDELTVTALWVSRADGSGAHRIGLSVLSPSCFPVARFVGGLLLLHHCPGVSGDGGGAADGRELLAVAPDSGATSVLARNLAEAPLWFDGASRRVLVADRSGRGLLVPIDGAPPVEIGLDVQDGFTKPGADEVVYRTSRGTLESIAPGQAVAPIVLVNAGVSKLHLAPSVWDYSRQHSTWGMPPAISPDVSRLLYSSSVDEQTEFFDLRMAALDHVAPVTHLVDGASSLRRGPGFSRDSTRALVSSDCKRVGLFVAVICTLHSFGRQGGARVEHGQDSYMHIPGRDSLLAFNANYQPYQSSGPAAGRADLMVVNMSGASPARQVAAQADAWFLVNASGTKVMYSVSNQGETGNGVYVADLTE